MPILGGIPVRTPRPPRVDPFEDSRTLAFRSLDGTAFMEFTGNEFFDLDGVEGLDLPPREVIRESMPNLDGTRLREVRTGERQVFLPFWLSSTSSHSKYLDRRDELASLFNYRGLNLSATDGTFDLVANSLRGERSLRCVYLDGMPGSNMTDNSGASWESLGLTFLACRPYWSGARWSTPTIQRPSGGSWGVSWPYQLSSAQALGSGIPVTVGGDVPSWPTIDLVGPASAASVTGPGLSVSIAGGLAAGETARIVTDPRGRTASFGGVKDWSRVAPTDRYRPLMPGVQELSIVLVGATDATSAVVSGDSLFERWC